MKCDCKNITDDFLNYIEQGFSWLHPEGKAFKIYNDKLKALAEDCGYIRDGKKGWVLKSDCETAIVNCMKKHMKKSSKPEYYKPGSYGDSITEEEHQANIEALAQESELYQRDMMKYYNE